MANQIQNRKLDEQEDKTPPPRQPAFPSQIHALLRMTPDEVEEDIVSRGKSAKGILKAFGRMEQRLDADLGDLTGNNPPTDSSAKRRDYRLDLVPNMGLGKTHGRKARTSPNMNSSQTDLSDMLDESSWESVIFAQARDNGMGSPRKGRSDGVTIIVDTASEPKDGDMVLVHDDEAGQVVRRLRIFDERSGALESVDDSSADCDLAHPSTFVIYGVVIARANEI